MIVLFSPVVQEYTEKICIMPCSKKTDGHLKPYIYFHINSLLSKLV